MMNTLMMAAMLGAGMMAATPRIANVESWSMTEYEVIKEALEIIDVGYNDMKFDSSFFEEPIWIVVGDYQYDDCVWHYETITNIYTKKSVIIRFEWYPERDGYRAYVE